MKFIQTEIRDVVLIEPQVFEDERGWFFESFNEERFHKGLSNLGLPTPKPFVQDNHSSSKQGVLRGLHFQLPPYEQGKLVRVVKGAAFDIAVDIRVGSLTYGKWVGYELSESNKRMLWIPEGFAHGFLSLANDTCFLYKTTEYYSKDSERSILWNDRSLNITWPLPSGSYPLVSEKDKSAPTLDFYNGK